MRRRRAALLVLAIVLLAVAGGAIIRSSGGHAPPFDRMGEAHAVSHPPGRSLSLAPGHRPPGRSPWLAPGGPRQDVDAVAAGTAAGGSAVGGASAAAPASGPSGQAAASGDDPGGASAADAQGESPWQSGRPVRFRPSWREADEWTVEHYVLDLANPATPRWRDPETWHFLVKGREDFEGVACLVIAALRLDARGQPLDEYGPTLFYVDDAAGRLVGVEEMAREAGEDQPRRLILVGAPGEPSSAPHTLAPFDLPALDAEGEARRGPSLPDLDLERLGRHPTMPASEELQGAGGERLCFRFQRHDGTSVYQEWDPADMRWPVVSRSVSARDYRRARH